MYHKQYCRCRFSLSKLSTSLLLVNRERFTVIESSRRVVVRYLPENIKKTDYVSNIVDAFVHKSTTVKKNNGL